MGMAVQPTGAACGAVVTGINLSEELSADLVADLRAHWLAHRLLIFPNQQLSTDAFARFTQYFGAFGEDPFFGSIKSHDHIAEIRREANETTPIFAENFHTDWSFLDIPPAGTALYSLKIPPVGGNTLFADQVTAYERLPDYLKETAESLTAIHSAALGYAPDGVYGETDQNAGRSMNILPSEKAMETCEHPFVRTHPETGEKALYSSPAYIQGFKGLEKAESHALMAEFYQYQTDDELTYSHKWEQDMLVMWDNRALLHAATGGYDGHARLLYRITIADTAF